jgi:hypothetical protein
MGEMINKTIGVSLMALTLVVSLFTASATTNVYADNDKEYKNKKANALRVIIDLIKEDYYDYYYDSDYRHHSKYERHHHYYDDDYDYNKNLYKVTVGIGTCYDVWPGYGYAVSKTYRLDYDKQVEYQFYKGTIKNNEPFYVYVENLDNGHNICEEGYNSPKKAPEYITVVLPD